MSDPRPCKHAQMCLLCSRLQEGHYGRVLDASVQLWHADGIPLPCPLTLPHSPHPRLPCTRAEGDTYSADTQARAGSGPNSSSGAAAPTAAGGKDRKPSIFGQARAREEVLKERGVDAASIDAYDYPARSNLGVGGGAHHGFGSGLRGSRAGSVTSGFSDEHGTDQWATVGTRGRVRRCEGNWWSRGCGLEGGWGSTARVPCLLP